MRHYKHLTLYERENLLFLKANGYSITAIAKSMGRNKGTISRELRRKSVANQYMPVVAQHQYQARHAYCKPHNRLKHARLLKHVKHRLLECQWSPEEIAGRLRAEYGRCVISTTTICRAIYSGWLNAPKASTASIIKKLRHRGKRMKKRSIEEERGKIQISHDITERPAGAENRSKIGHREADTVVDKQGKACLVTLVDRKSRYLMCGKADKKNAQAVSRAMVDLLLDAKALSVTPDKSKEFARYADTTEYLKMACHCLNYRTPYEVHFEEVLHLA
ncbi:MAG: IS30 family transposase [Selenomonas ruminantium]|jgi:IS30 family transposase|nr:IS30 family transposase [Selenomonas ruminantium]